MDEETERELIRRLSEKPGGSEIPPFDLLTKIVGEIPNPLPVAAPQKDGALPRTQRLRLAAMLILFVGAGFLATRIIPDLNPSHVDRTEAARPDRSTVTEPASPGAMPAAPPARVAAQNEKAKAASPSSRNQPQVFRDEASAEKKRRSETEGIPPGAAREQEKGAGAVPEIDRIDGDARLTEPRGETFSLDDASAGAAPAPRPLRKAEESVPAHENQVREKSALSTGPAATGTLSSAARPSTIAALGDSSGFVDVARQPQLETPLTDKEPGAVADLRRALDAGSLLGSQTARVDAFIALWPSQPDRHGMADEAIHIEGAPSPYGRGPRFILVLFELHAVATADPAKARVELDPALVSRYRLVGRSFPSAPGESIRLLYELELRREPGGDDRLLTLDVFSRSGSFLESVFSGRRLMTRWEDASVNFRFVSLAALLAERLQGLPSARQVDGEQLGRRLEEISRLRPRNADAQRLVRRAREFLDRPAPGSFAPEPDVRR